MTTTTSPKKSRRSTAQMAGLASVALLQLGQAEDDDDDHDNNHPNNDTAEGTTTSSRAPPTAETTTPRHHKSSGGAVPTTSLTTTSSGGSKKRPYRRTKRPANYCDKSTVTTITTLPAAPNDDDAAAATTMTAAPPLNAFDIVLAESQDLMQAAREAQQLGRLKMASTYLLLLHARLVGLGKRFDRSNNNNNNSQSTLLTNDNDNDEEPVDHDDDDDEPSSPGREAKKARTTGNDKDHVESPPRLQSTAQQQQPQPETAESFLSPADHTKRSNSNRNTLFTPKTAAAKQLASLLPNNIEMDQDMINHLARAAAQLHAARSGKGRASRGSHHHHHHNGPDGGALVQSPASRSGGGSTMMMNARDFFAQTANQKGIVTNPNQSASRPKKLPQPQPPTPANQSAAFSRPEHELLKRAAADGKEPNIVELAQQTGRSQVQIQAYYNNLSTKTRLEDHLDSLLGQSQEPEDNDKDAATPFSKTSSHGHNNNNNNNNSANNKGGRGRKPATTAINTVPNAVCDARLLLRGNALAYRNTNNNNDNNNAGTPEANTTTDTANSTASGDDDDQGIHTKEEGMVESQKAKEE